MLYKKIVSKSIDEQKILKNMENFFIKKRVEALKQAENENFEVAILMMDCKINQ